MSATPPPGTGIGANVQKLRPCSVTVRPLIVPTAAPNTTSLSQCTLSCRREDAMYAANVYPSTLIFQPRCRSITVAVANVTDECPDGNDRLSEALGLSRCTACFSASVST